MARLARKKPHHPGPHHALGMPTRADSPVSSLDALVLSQSREALLVLDPEGVVTRWSAGAQQLLGWHAREVVGRPVSLLWLPVAQPAWVEQLQALAPSGVWSGTCAQQDRLGKQLRLDTRLQGLVDQGGKRVAVLVVLREVAVAPSPAGASHVAATKPAAPPAGANPHASLHELIVDTAGEGVCAMTAAADEAGVHFTAWNGRMVELTGYTHEEINRVGWERVLVEGEEHAVPAGARLRMLLGSREPHQLVREITRKDGQRRFLRLSTAATTGQDGQPLTVALAMDVTELVATQQALQQSRSQLADALHLGGLGLLEIDTTTWTAKGSPAWCQMVGLEPGTVVADFREFVATRVHPDDQQRTAVSHLAALANGETEETMLRLLHPDSTVRSIFIRRRAQLDGSGNVAKVLATAQDLTARFAAKAELRASDERHRLALDAAQMGTWRLDASGQVLHLDARAQAHLDQSQATIPVDALLSRLHRDDVGRVQQVLLQPQTGAAEGAGAHVEARLAMPDGSLQWLALGSRVHLAGWSQEGQAVGLIGTTQDITRARQEQALANRQAQVLQRIATGAGLEDVAGDITAMVEELVPGVMASVGVVEADGVVLRVHGGALLPPAFVDAIQGVALGPEVMSCGTAAFFGQAVRCLDISKDPLWEHHREVALENGLRACCSLPVFGPQENQIPGKRGRVLGSLDAYRQETGPLPPGAADVLQAAARLAGVAMERDNAFHAIREGEERYRVISDITRTVTFGVRIRPDGSHTTEWARPHFGYLTGYTDAELPGGWDTVFHPEDRPAMRAVLARMFQGETARQPVRCITKSGACLSLLFQGRLVRHGPAPGEAVFVGGLQDVTALTETQVALQQSEERFQLAMHGANDGLWDWNLLTQEVFYSPRWKSMLGFAAHELPDTIHTFTELLNPEDRDAALALAQEFIAGRLQKYELEFRLAHRDGGYRNILSRASLVKDAHGTPVRMVGTHSDITDRKQAEAALRRSEEMLRRAQSMAHVGSWSLQLESGVFSASDEFHHIHGTRAGAVGLLELLANVHPDDAARVGDGLQQLAAMQTCDVELRLVSGGETKWVFVRAFVERGMDGNPEQVTGVTQDITQRRELESSLQQSQKMEAIGQLAGGVAHDFNNLLTVINSYGDLVLAELPEDAPMREDVAQMRDAGERAAALTRQLLAFSRKQLLELKVLDLNTVVTRAEKMLRRLIGEDIHITTLLDPHLARVKVDPGQVEQVLLNLAVNARDAMPTGGRLIIQTRNVLLGSSAGHAPPSLPAGTCVELAVSDSGTGMAPEVRERIFEPFFTTKAVGKGTGLGLATVYGIVKQSGGHIDVESQSGKGSTFRVHLPAWTEATGPGPKDTATLSRRSATETILLVEDEDAVRRVARISLESQGYVVLEACSGEAAMEAAGQHQGPIHLLITDVVMPSLSGPRVAEMLLERIPGLRVLFISGYTDDAMFRHGLQEAAGHFLHKPFTPVTLLAKARAVLESVPPPRA